MFNFIVALLKAIFSVILIKRKDVIFTLLLLKKENEIIKRHLNLQNRRIASNHSDRFCLSLIASLSKRAVSNLTIVKPETLLAWQRRFIKKRWSFKHKKRGRKPVSAELKKLILEMKTRKIVRYDLTENPCREFVKQKIELFSEEFQEKKTLIYDNAPQFTSIDYSWYGIKGVNISTSAPNMNAYTERFNGTIRREALDHFLLFSENQVQKIVTEYIKFQVGRES